MKDMLTNRILTALPDVEFTRLMPALEPVSLTAGERIAGVGETPWFVYFPEDSVVSSHAEMQDGKTVEIGMIGREGMAGLAALLGPRSAAHALEVAIGGSALRMRREDLERGLWRDVALRRALLDYAGEYVAQVSQRAACAVLHRLEQRLAIWLLMLTDRLNSDTVEITHERIAHHLGARRAGITEAAAELQHRGVISYTRGSLRIADRQLLEAVACECYGTLREARPQITH